MYKIMSLFLIFIPTLCIGMDVDEKIKKICGTHPLISYMRDFKGILMEPQILTEIEECAKGSGGAKIWKWELGDAKLQGCLTKKYGHQKKYIESIAAAFREARQAVSDQIKPYNSCANNVRTCGQAFCRKTNPKKKLLHNGEPCKRRSDCRSNYCLPGPSPKPIAKNSADGGLWYCTAADMNCAFPGTDGAKYGATISVDGSTLRCMNPNIKGFWGQFMR